MLKWNEMNKILNLLGMGEKNEVVIVTLQFQLKKQKQTKSSTNLNRFM